MATRGRGARNKGSAAEREVASILREYYPNAHRGMVFYHEPDIVGGVPGLHLEVKRQERTDLRSWMNQSTEQAKPGEIPTVVHRRNREQWLITMNLKDFLIYINERNNK